MIKLVRSGTHTLFETKHHIKILALDNDQYAWVEPPQIGEILVTSRSNHKTDCVLSIGDYRLYKVVDEPHLSDHIHLELEVGRGQWQGYLLLTGLPSRSKNRVRIIPTTEVISGNHNELLAPKPRVVADKQ
ncbi:MAG TPA: hypothetical protein PK096_00710 [Candidatus Saccharibacteria bacterium]|nr:hypothetical protein [Candidatus Saccharibacteria bacterium]HRK93874.1 hypothetical protein [Candidatus Saccharibacteria bacterium]